MNKLQQTASLKVTQAVLITGFVQILEKYGKSWNLM